MVLETRGTGSEGVIRAKQSITDHLDQNVASGKTGSMKLARWHAKHRGDLKYATCFHANKERLQAREILLNLVSLERLL